MLLQWYLLSAIAVGGARRELSSPAGPRLASQLGEPGHTAIARKRAARDAAPLGSRPDHRSAKDDSQRESRTTSGC